MMALLDDLGQSNIENILLLERLGETKGRVGEN